MTATSSLPATRSYAPFEVAEPSDVLAAAGAAREHALLAGLDAEHAEALAAVVTELGENAMRHGGGGELRVEASPGGWVVRAEDRGPGFLPEQLVRLSRRETPPPGDAGSVTSGLLLVRRLASLELFNLRHGAVAVARRVVAAGATRR